MKETFRTAVRVVALIFVVVPGGCRTPGSQSAKNTLATPAKSLLPARQDEPRYVSEQKPDPRLGKTIDESQAAAACAATGREFQSKGHERQAIAMFERARHHDSKVADVARHLAVLYDHAGEYHKAEKEYLAAIDEAPRDADIHNDYGYFHYQRGQLAKAEAEFRRAIELAPAKERAWTNLGMTLAHVGRWEESLAAFTRASGPAAARYNIAALQAQAGHPQVALGNAELAIQLQPTLQRAVVLREKLRTALAQQPTQHPQISQASYQAPVR